MGISKVVYNKETLIDLTGDTVTAETLAEGETAHGADGELITGTMARSSGTSIESCVVKIVIDAPFFGENNIYYVDERLVTQTTTLSDNTLTVAKGTFIAIMAYSTTWRTDGGVALLEKNMGVGIFSVVDSGKIVYLG